MLFCVVREDVHTSGPGVDRRRREGDRLHARCAPKPGRGGGDLCGQKAGDAQRAERFMLSREDAAPSPPPQ